MGPFEAFFSLVFEAVLSGGRFCMVFYPGPYSISLMENCFASCFTRGPIEKYQITAEWRR